MTANDSRKTLQEAIRFYSDFDVCQTALVEARWPDGVTCPTCGSREVGYLANQRRWQCKAKPYHAKRQFSAKVGTIFEDSPIKLDKWFVAIWLIGSAKNGISSYELSRAIGVTQKSAWFMLHRIRLAMQTKSFSKPFGGEVEVDETFIGAKARNMHYDRKVRALQGARGAFAGKVAVMGLLQRHGKDGHSQVRTEVVPNVRRQNLQYQMNKHVKMDGNTTVYSDKLMSYLPVTPKGWRPSDLYIHKVIDHSEAYVNGQIHTNGLENFWSLLKRMIKGTYVSVEPFHLFRYLDEEAFRFNSRKMTDGDRFNEVKARVTGKRLTYAELTAKPQEQSA
jgi:transposase-like protein